MTFLSKKISIIITSVLLCLSSAQNVFADDFKIADLEILHPHAKAPLTNSRVTAGYFTIKNTGSTDDKLLAVKVEFAEKAEFHEMKIIEGVMKMRPLENGVVIPSGKSVTYSSNGNHIMFIKLKDKIVEGDKRKAILVFENAGEVEVHFEFESFSTIKKRARMVRMGKTQSTNHKSNKQNIKEHNHEKHHVTHSDYGAHHNGDHHNGEPHKGEHDNGGHH